MLDQAFVLRAPSLNSSADAVSQMDNALAQEQQDRLRNLATLLPYRRGQKIYSQDEDVRFVHFISSGLVRVFRSTENGKRQIISFRAQGDLCGLPQEGRYLNSAETVSISMIYRVSWELFHQLLVTSAQLQLTLLKKVTADFRDAQSRILMLGQENIFHRVATFLVDMMAVTQFFDARESTLYLPMSRFDVADYLGTSPETAGRAFTKLENMGIIRRLSPRRIEILDMEKLRLIQRGPRRCQNQAGQVRSGFEAEAGAARALQ
jgi:CRP-like cAMP-binding protein